MARRGQPQWSPLVRRCLGVFAPPEKLTTSEWAEKYRVLSRRASAMPGPWRNSVAPYLAGIMDAFDDPAVEQIAFCKPTQVGGTEVELNLIGKVIASDPSPTLVVYPTEASCRTVSANRIRPMLEDSPQLSERLRRGESSLIEYRFDGMTLLLAWAGSPVALASNPIRILMLDEVDKYVSNAGREADPVALARERTKTFDNRKIYLTSTPTLSSGKIWSELKAADCELHYFVPCPECGAYGELAFDNIRFPSEPGMSRDDRAAAAVYICPECGALIPDTRKPGMLRAGEWRAVRGRRQGALKLGFWMNALYSPWVTWSQVVNEFLRDKDEPELLQNFVNSWLAEPWEDLRMRTDADMVLERCGDELRWQVPDWAELLTGGVDVQRDRLYWVLRAWGPGMTSQGISHGYCESWDEVTSIMSQTYRKRDGVGLMVGMCGIDSGDQTDMVLQYCLAHIEWAVPVKGQPTTPAIASGFRLSHQAQQGRASRGWTLTLVYGDKYKDMIASRLRLPMGTGCWMNHADCDRDYAEQVTAEQKVADKTGRETWKPRTSHAANHYLDAEVYAFAVADRLGVRQLGLDDAGQSDAGQQGAGDLSTRSVGSPPAGEVVPPYSPAGRGWLAGVGGDWVHGSGGWMG